MSEEDQPLPALVVDAPVSASAGPNSQRATPAPIVDVPEDLTATLTVWRGDDSKSRRARIAEAESPAIPFHFSQGFAVLHPIILQHLRAKLPPSFNSNISSSLAIKIKPTLDSSHLKFAS
jgi:hypothetical protein